MDVVVGPAGRATPARLTQRSNQLHPQLAPDNPRRPQAPARRVFMDPGPAAWRRPGVTMRVGPKQLVIKRGNRIRLFVKRDAFSA